MAENQEDRSREDLTEDASPHRIEEYRNRGQVAQSKDITAVLALFAAGVTAYMLAPKMGADLSGYMREVFQTDLQARVNLNDNTVLATTLMKALHIMIIAGLPVCCAGFLMGVVGSLAQIGTIFSTDPITPDFSKVNPLKGIQRLLTLKLVLDGAKIIFKMTIIASVAYGLVKTQIINAPGLLDVAPLALFGMYGSIAKSMFLSLCGILVIFAGFDFGLQKWDFSKNLRMTKQEAKQEYKEREGDPQIKARIRSVQREMARKRMMQAVKKADVIITNPTHIAIAIVYEKDMAAPRVVAKGADFVAEKIRKIALEAGVPLVENVPLARTLYKSVKVGHYIPRALYQAVAEVLAYVFKLKNKRF